MEGRFSSVPSNLPLDKPMHATSETRARWAALASRNMKYAGRILAGLYAAIVVLAVPLALTTEIYFRRQQTEDLLPSFVLAFVTLPLPLAGEPLYFLAPSFFEAPFVQTAFLTVCGAVQASILWWLASPQEANSAR